MKKLKSLSINLLSKSILFFVFISCFSSCDPSGNDEDDLLPEEPLVKFDPNVSVPLQSIIVEKFGNAVELVIFPVNGKNFGLLSGEGDYSFKLSTKLEKFHTPDFTGVGGSALDFTEIPDSLFMFKNDKLFALFTMTKGTTPTGVPYSYTYTDHSTLSKLISEKFFMR